MKEGLTETEADIAALEAAKAFQAELVKQGVLEAPKPVDPNFTSEVIGGEVGQKQAKRGEWSSSPRTAGRDQAGGDLWRRLVQGRVQGLGTREAPRRGAQGEGAPLGTAGLQAEGALAVG
ncbi:unnamed protein product [Durusdinium trenchii]|uniref:Uncharacterized protein n=2 Tax=Durusdinium trenchii TaxID=1381693 RepID=A0ABP0IH47_9DINO